MSMNPIPQKTQRVEPTGAQEWARCRDYLIEALTYDGGFYEIEDIEQLILSGDAQFWPGKQSAVVTQFWMFPRAKALNYWLAGGNMVELLEEMQPAIEEWARLNGCTHIIIAGRKGWERAMRPHGFTPAWTALRKVL